MTKSRNKIINVLIPSLVMLDMLSVSLVVPLLHQYFLQSGVTDARQRELLSSIYSTSQIIGGLTIGILNDTKILSRRNTLLLSFVGSCVSYGMIASQNFWALVFSRILVGFVKQTMTVSTSLLAMHNSSSHMQKAEKDEPKPELSVLLGRIKASSTIAWIVGPSLGAFLYKNLHASAPPLVASSIFGILFCVGYGFLPNDLEMPSSLKQEQKSTKNFNSMISNLKSTLQEQSATTLCTIVALLLYTWIIMTTSYTSMASYYEERYDLEPHYRGYLSSYRAILSFGIQSVCIQPLLELYKNEQRAIVMSAFIMSLVSLWETRCSFGLFIVVLCPIFSGCLSLLDISLKSRLTQVTPSNMLGSTLASLDVLQNVVKVSVPFYRAFLFSYMTSICGQDELCTMKGDPDPFYWNLSSSFHWCLTTFIFYHLLMRNNLFDFNKKVQ